MLNTYNPEMPSSTFDVKDYEVLKASQIPATLSETRAMRFDSAEDASVFFARELDFIKTQTYDVLYPEFTAMTLFPQSSTVDAGAETVTYYSYDKTGMAKIISNYATDLPRADAKGKPTTGVIKSIGVSYGYSVQEMRASRMVGKSLDVRKGDSARYAIEYALNKIAWSGDEESGLMGVLSPDNDIPMYTLPLNAAGLSTKFADKEPHEILRDINAFVAYTAVLTKSVEKPDTLALPTDAYLHLADTPMIVTPGTGVAVNTVLQWVLANSPRLKYIVEAPELNADSGMTPFEGIGCAFMFKKDPLKFTIENPLAFYQHPIQPKGLEFEVPCEARTAGAIIYYPLSMLIIPGV